MPDSLTRSALPRYVQIAEMLIRQIAAGQLVDGARLPPEREMAVGLGVSVGTLRKALAELEGKGLVVRRQGSGNYVQARAGADSVYALFRLELHSGGGLPTADILETARLPKPDGAPAFGPAGDAHRIRRLRRLDGQPVAVEEIWLDADAAPDLRVGDLSESLYQHYARRLGLIVTRVEDRIGAAPLPDWGAAPLGGDAGRIVGHVHRLAVSQHGRPFEYSRTWFDPDRCSYVSRLGKG